MRSIKNFISYLQNRNKLFIISIVWILVLFLSWDLSLRQFFASGIFYSVNVLGDYWAISSQATWLPLIAEISRGNLFPIDPFLGQADSDFGFFPYLSLWFSGLLISVFGIGGTFVIGSSILPTLSYIFMVLIYRCFLNWRWSISLSALGIMGFIYDPFREFLLGIILGEGWLTLGSDSLPSAAGFPFPAISLLSFLIVFYLSIQRRYMSKRRSIILSIAWGLQSQIHIINLIFGVPFWVLFLGLKIWRSSNNNWPHENTKQLFFHIAIVAIFCIPMIISMWLQFDSGLGLDYLTGPPKVTNSFDWFFILAYCVFPLLLLRLAYGVFRIDPYELLIKFLPVWVAMIVELVLSLSWQFFGIGIPSELLQSRLGLYFLHVFYFAPVIYCMHRSIGNYSIGPESLLVSYKIRSFCIWLFKDASLIFLPCFLILLSVFFITSSEKSYEKFQDVGFLNSQKSELIDNLLTSEIKPGEVLIGPDHVSNLLLPIKGRYGGLWTNQIISNASSSEIIERFATYGKVMGWTETQFLKFMLPSIKPFNQSELLLDISGNEVVPGLGYWLTYHNNSLSSVQLEDFSSELIRVYSSINLIEKLNDYNVKRMVLENELQYNFYSPAKKVGKYFVFNF